MPSLTERSKDIKIDDSDRIDVTIRDEASAEQTFTIADGADGSAVNPVDLGAPYKMIAIRCTDAQWIPAATSLSAYTGFAAADTLCRVYEENDPSTAWAEGDLPVTGTLVFILTHAFGARRVRLVLSNNSTGGATAFGIRGFCRMEQL